MTVKLVGKTCEYDAADYDAAPEPPCLAPPFMDYLCARHWRAHVGYKGSLDLRIEGEINARKRNG